MRPPSVGEIPLQRIRCSFPDRGQNGPGSEAIDALSAMPASRPYTPATTARPHRCRLGNSRWGLPLAPLLAVLLALLITLLPPALAAAGGASRTPDPAPAAAGEISSAVVAAVQRSSAEPGLSLRKVPGPAPRQTIGNFLSLSEAAEMELRAALRLGLTQAGPFYAQRNVQQQVQQAVDQLQQATQALDLSQIPAALRPMTGVGTMLQLRSVLRYDLAHSPGLVLPDQAQASAQHLQTWTLPDTPITLQAMTSAQVLAGTACRACSAGDYLFTSHTLEQVPEDFARIFNGNPSLRRQFGADLYTYWALLPGGAIPPKWFFRLSPELRRTLVTQLWGQSLLQWLLLVPFTLLALALMGWWMLRLRRWHRRGEEIEGLWPHLLRVLAVLPPLLLLTAWQWFAIDWINLIGARQEVVLVGSRVISGLLLALLIYLLAEAIGQVVTVRRQRDGEGRLWLERRKGSGQILTLARIAGLLAVVVVLVRTAQDLGLTAITLLALSSVPALAISLGTQQLIRDIADGFSILLDGQIRPGDRCTIGTTKSGEIRGRILSLGMRSMRLEQEDGSVLSLPNSQVAASVVTNHRFRTGQPLKLSLPIQASEEPLVLDRLSQARALLLQIPELSDGQAELESVAAGWQLKLVGRWRQDLSRSDLAAAREGLYLRLMQLLRQEDSPAQALPLP